MQYEVDERSFATRWTGSLGSDGVTMLTLDDASRPARVALVRDAVAAGHYRPPADAVAERLLAFLAPPWPL